MRLLLPPSESKRDGMNAVPVDLDSLVAQQLGAQRLRILNALSRFCAKPTPRVREAIGTTANQDDELQRNERLHTAPTAAAHDIYAGVLFDAIDLPGTAAGTRQRIIEQVLVQSALFGVVGLGDHIPAYRCSADSTLPRIGRLAGFWRSHLRTVMPQLLEQHLIVDLRSGSYASLWTPTEELRTRTAVVRVMQERNGRRLAVSHMNKATKGRLVRALCEPEQAPGSIDEAAQAIALAGYDVELVDDSRAQVIEVLA